MTFLTDINDVFNGNRQPFDPAEFDINEINNALAQIRV